MASRSGGRSVRSEPHHGRIAAEAPPRTTIAELRAGTDVDAVFACARKDRLTARSGSAYLALELRDRTGSLPARAFRDADFLAGRFDRGDLVRVRGRVERFREELQIEVRAIERAGGDGEVLDEQEFLPTAYRDLDELDGFLEHLAREVHDPAYRRCSTRCSPTSRSGPSCAGRPAHGAEIGLSEDGALLGHLTLGSQLLAERAGALAGFPPEKLRALQHCLLGHHGPDALPGRRYRSAEALALARLNAVDAAVKAVLEHGLR